MKFTENIDLTVAQKKTTETATENVGRQNDGKEFKKKKEQNCQFPNERQLCSKNNPKSLKTNTKWTSLATK